MMKIDEALVEKLLRKAKAPPVISADGVPMIVQSLAEIVNFENEMKNWPKERSQFERAQDAVDELRRVIPEIITGLRLASVADQRLSGKADELEVWAKTIPDFLPRKHKWPKPWTMHALMLFSGYQRATGHCGASKDGPAVRFIKAAFDHCDLHKKETLSSISKAIYVAQKQPEMARHFNRPALNAS